MPKPEKLSTDCRKHLRQCETGALEHIRYWEKASEDLRKKIEAGSAAEPMPRVYVRMRSIVSALDAFMKEAAEIEPEGGLT